MKSLLPIFLVLFTACAAESAEPSDKQNDQPVLMGCDATSAQAMDILTKDCASCHGGATPGQNQGGFSKILDPNVMIGMTSNYAKDDEGPAHFLTPGDPQHSRIYLRPLNGEMPPADIIGLPAYPRPTAADLSVLQSWIHDCL